MGSLSYLGFWLNLHLHFPPVRGEGMVEGEDPQPCPALPARPPGSPLTHEDDDADGA